MAARLLKSLVEREEINTGKSSEVSKQVVNYGGRHSRRGIAERVSSG